MTQRSGAGGFVRSQNALIWLGLVIGAEGFALGAATNPSALASLWAYQSWFWLAVLAVAAVLAAIAQRMSRRSEAFTVLLGCIIAVAAFGIAAFAAVLLILLAAYALGASLLGWTRHNESDSLATDVFTVTAIGLSACSLLLGFAAHAHINVPIAYLAFSAIWLTLGWRHVAGAWKRFVATRADIRQDRTPLLLCAALWFAFSIHVCYTALPERFHDALAMHLVIARALQLFGFWHFDVSEYAWAVQPMGANWLFGWAYVLAGEYAAKLLNGVFLLLICGVMIEARAVSKPLGLFAVTIFVLTPLTFIETATLFVDNALTLFVVTAVVFAARIRELPSSTVVASFAIASAGAMAVKLLGVAAFAATCLALLVLSRRRERLAIDGRTSILCLGAAIAGVWPYAYAWYATANPVFPYFNAIFKSPFFALHNFVNVLYPGGLSFADFYQLTFSSAKHLEGWDGAIGFAMTLLLPAALLTIAATGTHKLKLIALAAIAYTAIVLLNTRYVRYLFPVFPLFALMLVYPLSVASGRTARGTLLFAAALGIGFGFLRIPAAGWILLRFDPSTAFSTSAKESLADIEAPQRKMGRVQAAIGDNSSRVVIFGQNVGADIRGRPIYVGWYYQKLEERVWKKATLDEAAATLAALDATHVIFDRRRQIPEWAPWHAAVERYGRLIIRDGLDELFEFDATAVPGADVFAGSTGPWQGWEVGPKQEQPMAGTNLLLPPATGITRPADLAKLPDGAQISLSASHVCDAPTTIRAQINWLRLDGSVMRADATQSACGDTPGRARIRLAKPAGAQIAYFYFINDGGASARLYDGRVTVSAKP